MACKVVAQLSAAPACVAGRPASAAKTSRLSAAPAARRAAVRAPVKTNAAAAQQQQQQAQWENNVRSGKVKNIQPQDVKGMLADGWVLLDVRPKEEFERARIESAVEVPLFVVDDDMSPSGLLKQATQFGMGGWWLGGAHMKPNESFMGEVQAKIPKDAKVIVGCQKGLRSLAACEQLGRAGYEELAWINGGFDTARKGDLPVIGDIDIRMAGIGGLSELMGWTDVQREVSRSQGFMGGQGNILKIVGVILAIDLVWGAYEVFFNSTLF